MPGDRLAGERVAAFFDLDRTMLPTAAAMYLALPLLRRRVLRARVVVPLLRSRWLFEKRGYSDDEIAVAFAWASRMIEGMSVATMLEVAALVTPRKIIPALYPDARACLERHQQAGDLTMIVSSGPVEVVERVGEALSVDGFAASRAEVHDGRYTGRMLTHCHSLGKADAVARFAVEHGVDLAASTAYGDSLSDLPMLDLVGTPVGVNVDRRLRAVALTRGWRTVEWRPRHRARLRARRGRR